MESQFGLNEGGNNLSNLPAGCTLTNETNINNVGNTKGLASNITSFPNTKRGKNMKSNPS